MDKKKKTIMWIVLSLLVVAILVKHIVEIISVFMQQILLLELLQLQFLKVMN